MSNKRAPSHDERWGDHVPWSLRYNVVINKGDYIKFCSLLSVRLSNFLQFNEAAIKDVAHFRARLSVESLGKFWMDEGWTPSAQVKLFFSSEELVREINRIERETRKKADWGELIVGRLEVLQSFLFLSCQLQTNDSLKALVRDIRRFAAESDIMLDIKGNPPALLPVEEPLLQKEVIDKLLPRLETKYPDRAADLMKAYHDVLKGVDTNTVFGNAFKALEELAREISGEKNLELSDRSALEKHFSKLHGTIRETILKLAGHRGDEGAHGRKGPDEYEIRYLLLSVCNIALLLLEYKEQG